MYEYLENMKKLLDADPDAKRQFENIYAPVVVGIPPSNAEKGFRVMPDGEIRHYGLLEQKALRGSGVQAYLYSRDCGMSWKAKYCKPGEMVASSQNPYTGRWISVWGDSVHYDDGNGRVDKKVLDYNAYTVTQPIFLTHRNRAIIPVQINENGYHTPMVIISDDNGESWKSVKVKQPPMYEVEWPSVDVRWRISGTEPTIVELPDRTIMMLIRTALDRFYVAYSHDDGDTWTDPEPSIFYSVSTTPYLLRLSDGRIVCTWCNTRSLPEQNHKLQMPPVRPGCANGGGEDAFTNRDAAHAAISYDGYHWIGFREVLLNAIRNYPDFRSNGGIASSEDKSVHQSQIIELPYNKVMVAFGQHEASRRLVIFDLDWLFETSRSEDFQRGLESWSTQTYVKSISDSYCFGEGINGHCAWNRTNGALLVPDPAGTHREALQLCRIRDPRLVSEVQGAVWNFPATRKGELKLQIRVVGAGIRISLADRWFNPIDTSIRDAVPITFEINKEALGDSEQHEVTIKWNLDEDFAYVFDGEKKLFRVRTRMTVGELPPVGISYLHMHSTAEEPDPYGTYILGVSMEGEGLGKKKEQ